MLDLKVLLNPRNIINPEILQGTTLTTVMSSGRIMHLSYDVEQKTWIEYDDVVETETPISIYGYTEDDILGFYIPNILSAIVWLRNNNQDNHCLILPRIGEIIEFNHSDTRHQFSAKVKIRGNRLLNVEYDVFGKAISVKNENGRGILESNEMFNIVEIIIR